MVARGSKRFASVVATPAYPIRSGRARAHGGRINISREPLHKGHASPFLNLFGRST